MTNEQFNNSLTKLISKQKFSDKDLECIQNKFDNSNEKNINTQDTNKSSLVDITSKENENKLS